MPKYARRPRKPKSSRVSRKTLSTVAWAVVASVAVVLVAVFYRGGKSLDTDQIKIGLNTEITGAFSLVGRSSKLAAELAVKEVNDQGGLLVNERRYPVVLEIQSNSSSPDVTTLVQKQLINDGVLAIIGPNVSSLAVPSSDISEKGRVLMITPWSTSPETTLNRANSHKKYVYRTGFVDSSQGQALAQFAYNNLKAKKAAVIYDQNEDVLKRQADVFQSKFASIGGLVVTSQSFRSGDKDFKSQLTQLKKENPEIIFLPAYYSDASKIIKQARTLGITVKFLGSDAWGGETILKECGYSCNGSYLSAHYAPDDKSQVTQRFVQSFKNAYGSTPDDVAALTYDSLGLLFRAIQNAGRLNRELITQGMAKISQHDGVTGALRYQSGSGDPTKPIVIFQVVNGKLVWQTNIEL